MVKGQYQDGGGLGWGDHLLPDKFIKRSYEFGATSTKQLINTGGGHQIQKKKTNLFKRTKYKRCKERQRI